MERTVIDACTRMSFADVPFPEVVKHLAGAGVSAYRADLIRLAKTYYDAASDTCERVLPLEEAPPVPGEFDEGAVNDAVRAVQACRIGYAAFLRRIMAAGCASYSVFIEGRKAIYFGRNGAFHVENFPDPN